MCGNVYVVLRYFAGTVKGRTFQSLYICFFEYNRKNAINTVRYRRVLKKEIEA